MPGNKRKLCCEFDEDSDNLAKCSKFDCLEDVITGEEKIVSPKLVCEEEFNFVQDSESKKGRNKNDRKYRPEWDNDPEVKGWSCANQYPQEKNKTAFCIPCRIPLFGHLQTLKKHSRTKEHKKQFAAYVSCNEKIGSMSSELNTPNEYDSSISSVSNVSIKSSQSSTLDVNLDAETIRDCNSIGYEKINLSFGLCDSNNSFQKNEKNIVSHCVENDYVNSQLSENITDDDFFVHLENSHNNVVCHPNSVSVELPMIISISDKKDINKCSVGLSIDVGENANIDLVQNIENTVHECKDLARENSLKCDMKYVDCAPMVDQSDKKEKCWYQYNKKWEIKYEWIGPVPNDKKLAHCKTCEKNIKAKRNVVADHGKSLEHLEKKMGEEWYFEKFDFQAAMTEIKLAAFYVMKELPFAFSDAFDDYSKIIFFDSINATIADLDRKKTANILRNVIAPAHIERLVGILNNKYFSVLVDECTDITGHACLCIVVRYVDDRTGQIVDSLFDLVRVYDTDENASPDSETLAAKVLKPFKDANIKSTNILSFCSDNASVMISEKADGKSVANILLKEMPHLVIARCSAHLLHLCAKDAAEVLEGIEEDKFSKILNAFNAFLAHSSKKKNEWEVAQKKCDVRPLVVKTPVTTRFLNKLECMIRIYERWAASIVFFDEEIKPTSKKNEEKFAGEKFLREYFLNEKNIVFHLFLVSILDKVQKANVAMQLQKPVVTQKMSVQRKLFLDTVSTYMKEDYIKNTPLEEINPEDITQFKKLNQITLRYYVREEFNTHMKSPDDQKNFFLNCQKYLVRLAVSIRKRCLVKDGRVKHMICFYPQNALSVKFHQNGYDNLIALLAACPYLTDNHDSSLIKQINAQWDKLTSYKFPDDIVEETQSDRFWYKLYKYEDANGSFPFRQLGEFALKYMTIPHGNASSERVWSKLGRQKTKKRASLKFPSIRAILLSIQYILDIGGIMKFEPTMYMYRRMAVNLNDKPDNSQNYEDKSTFKKRKITDDDRIKCLKQMKLGAKLRKGIKFDPSQSDSSENSDDDARLIISRNVENEGHLAMRNNESFRNDEIIAPVELTVERVRVLMENGLYNDFQYYFIRLFEEYFDGTKIVTRTKQYTVGRYMYSKKHLFDNFRNAQFQLLFAGPYQSLEKPNWLDGEVIDACATVYERNWNDAVFISTMTTEFFFKDDWVDGNSNPILPGREWFMFTCQFPSKGKLFLPYLKDNHWRLFEFNVESKVIRLYDPKNVSFEDIRFEFERVVSKFRRYHTLCQSLGIYNSLTSCSLLDWRCEYFNEVSTTDYANRPYQTDGHSCGVFVLYLMNVLAGVEKLDVLFNPDKRRIDLANMLLNESADMRNICLLCFNKPTEDNVALQCNTCNRYVHIRCLRSNYDMSATGKCELCNKHQRN